MLPINNLMPMGMNGLNFGLGGSQSQFSPISGYTPLNATAGGAGMFGGFGMNLPTAGLLLGGLNAIGNLWGANKSLGLARDQFDFTREITNKNLANQTQTYNTALEDRARSRAVAQGQSQSDADAYLERHRLK
ncbi:hypothetical protein PP742_gp22 [Alcaligenes phage vB_Af_QDWS595]|uniref:Uncharacterized protein n=1 Tax=Alcaligenes phage vB_Af_QDWS595 TaxID=2877946 RepID=A0AAE8Y680_9CAUD|nr:hypothetical protein PP742_gp22 [Alcaligenes phage vB_Af_QDWS595]UCR75506.1 hypothetical protein vBAfaPQDWS595_22 [Alcaligenes phage vB_Af_QDWS595]